MRRIAFLYPNLPPKPSSRLKTWHWDGSNLESSPNATDAPLAVGSLQKPFVVRAWAMTHPGQEAPRVACTSTSGCWHRGGHGEIGLARATAVSCNSYFRHLAMETPLALLAASLHREGFRNRLHSPEAAIGLADGQPLLVISPSALLAAYADLVRTPWAVGEPIQRQLLAGLREAALTGTAGALKQRGYWAKTGTIPSPSGNPLQTCGLALAVDDAGWAILA
ncbi:MAG: hypothetical protein Q8O00_05515, partial [Holophaga sp.]|nr:hypothetical protein [Holophaga sp.]